MTLEPLMQRGVLYGLISGGGTTVLIVLLATVLNLSLGPTAILLLFGSILSLALLLGIPGIGPGPAESNFGGSERYVSNPTEVWRCFEKSGSMVIVPSTKLEYVAYFLGLGFVATVPLPPYSVNQIRATRSNATNSLWLFGSRGSSYIINCNISDIMCGGSSK